MPETFAFLFPGQGQLPTSVPSLDAEIEGLYARAERDGLALRTWIASGNVARLALTDAAQPAVFLDSLARAHLLRSSGLHPDVVAGHSLGEYAALVVAGVLPAEAALALVVRRGRLMAAVRGGMTAVLKLELETVRAICDAVGGRVTVANYNGSSQFVVSGPVDDLDRVGLLVTERGGRAIRLDVSGPFHSPAMRPAEDELRPDIQSLTFAAPHVSFVSSVTGRVEAEPAALRELLARQMTASVRWTDVIQTLTALGVTQAVEVGSGSVLAQLGRRAQTRVRFLTYEEVSRG